MPVQIINYSSFEALHCEFISFYIIILRISLNYDRELRLSFFSAFVLMNTRINPVRKGNIFMECM